jgi:hypothetical protein
MEIGNKDFRVIGTGIYTKKNFDLVSQSIEISKNLVAEHAYTFCFIEYRRNYRD